MWLKNFNQMRQESGMSLDDLSEKSGVPKGTLAKITSGITKAPSLETMRSLVYAMGYTLDDLDRGIKTKKSPAPSEDSAGENGKLSMDEVEKALLSLGLIKEGQDITDDDLRFINSVLDLVDMWFKDRHQQG